MILGREVDTNYLLICSKIAFSYLWIDYRWAQFATGSLSHSRSEGGETGGWSRFLSKLVALSSSPSLNAEDPVILFSCLHNLVNHSGSDLPSKCFSRLCLTSSPPINIMSSLLKVLPCFLQVCCIINSSSPHHSISSLHPPVVILHLAATVISSICQSNQITASRALWGTYSSTYLVGDSSLLWSSDESYRHYLRMLISAYLHILGFFWITLKFFHKSAVVRILQTIWVLFLMLSCSLRMRGLLPLPLLHPLRPWSDLSSKNQSPTPEKTRTQGFDAFLVCSYNILGIFLSTSGVLPTSDNVQWKLYVLILGPV